MSGLKQQLKETKYSIQSLNAGVICYHAFHTHGTKKDLIVCFALFCGFVWSFEGSVRRTFVVCADLPLFARSTTKPANFFWSLEHPGLLNTQLLHCKILLLLPSTNLGYGMFFHLCSAVDDQITTSHQRVWLQHLHFSSR